jgi:triosephosphate isomerase (TIM)
MKKLIVANWKELPQTWGQAEEILARADECLSDLSSEALAKEGALSLVICPPFKYLEQVAKVLQTGHLEHMAELGAQDIPERLEGIRYVIIGHSSRRGAGETDDMVNQKLKFVLGHELVPIVCVESAEQARATFAGIAADDLARCLVAYEPVWAISTNSGGHPDTPENAAQAVRLIREVIGDRAHTLYGGSITEKNAQDFLSRPEFSGVLIGGASVRAEEFCRILSIAAQLP